MITPLVERTCPTCGNVGYAGRNCPCAICSGMMHRVVTLIPSKRVSGVLCRDGKSLGYSRVEIFFVYDVSLTDVRWGCDQWLWDAPKWKSWTREQWREQYGKLPRKGSKEMVLLELSNDR
ncbi:hypothetical protein LCGC14_1737210 [marine sediment metagenome]|uniref:Uncharacterized protein n=1 Tax=marine sediment metagenome TaxID=412755 RepID=A0A0F9JN24_9ZZZZ